MNREINQLLEFSQLFDYQHDNDREIVIVGCAYLESLIKDILEATFLDDINERKALLSDSTGSLSSLIPRARLLYLLGIIPKTVYKDIKIVGKIRNEFAHNVAMSFDNNKIKQLCDNLEWHIQSLFMKPPTDETSRNIYQVGVNQLVTHLEILPSLQKSKMLKNK